MANDILVAMEQAQIQLGGARCSPSSIKRTTKQIKLRMGPQDAKGVPPRNLERFCPRHSLPCEPRTICPSKSRNGCTKRARSAEGSVGPRPPARWLARAGRPQASRARPHRGSPPVRRLRYTPVGDPSLLARPYPPQQPELDRAPRHQRGDVGDQPPSVWLRGHLMRCFSLSSHSVKR
jgi:hypothetical protein